jgi:hypothetical protein
MMVQQAHKAPELRSWSLTAYTVIRRCILFRRTASYMTPFLPSLLLGAGLLRNTLALSTRRYSTSMSSLVEATTLKMALCQFNVGSDKAVNIKHASDLIDRAASAEIVVGCSCDCFFCYFVFVVRPSTSNILHLPMHTPLLYRYYPNAGTRPTPPPAFPYTPRPSLGWERPRIRQSPRP